ncbi:MAG: 5-formyltetrahydrofolate cyclo-ligase [Bacteroidetes bacterium SB0662_bin_6]|nr:5-formyltetrahydrofolate cyclo-ligase [Bacteroidetes bacterium SB0668_bin_1]MYE04993.1 5-formyltetrahydrofolate cyclo-ligase [Bacteroidetes bacterium SB0662_bin_6]
MSLHPDKTDSSEKSRLRKQFDNYRKNLAEDDYARRSAAMVERILALPELDCAGFVLAYWPMIQRHEPDMRSLITRLRKQDVAVGLPLVPDIGVPSMYAVRYTGEEPIMEPPWGIPRPAGSEQVPSDRIDTVIVPMLGGARDGHRIGHGKGYYDAFLQGLQAIRIGVTYQACLLESIPSELHDMRMDILVTEEEVVRTEAPV